MHHSHHRRHHRHRRLRRPRPQMRLPLDSGRTRPALLVRPRRCLTTFSFLGLAGIAFGGGVSAVFAVGYLTISCIGLYFVTPRLRELGANRGYLRARSRKLFRSRKAMGRLVAVVGALFPDPVPATAITGLGLIVQLATGSESARGLSMAIATPVVFFVIWAGIRGLARVTIFKDFGMLRALVIVLCGVFFGIGGIPEVFSRVADAAPSLLTLSAPAMTQRSSSPQCWSRASDPASTPSPTFGPPYWPPKAAPCAQQLQMAHRLPARALVPIMVGMASILIVISPPKATRSCSPSPAHPARMAYRRHRRLRRRRRHGSRRRDRHGHLLPVHGTS